MYSIDKDQPVTDVDTIETLLNQYVYRGLISTFYCSASSGTRIIFGAPRHLWCYRQLSLSKNSGDWHSHALGATFGKVIAMVLSSGMKLVGAGVLVGLAGSLLSVRVLTRQVWRLSTFDPYSFIAVSILVLAAGALACFWPARSASRIDQLTALRHE